MENKHFFLMYCTHMVLSSNLLCTHKYNGWQGPSMLQLPAVVMETNSLSARQRPQIHLLTNTYMHHSVAATMQSVLASLEAFDCSVSN